MHLRALWDFRLEHALARQQERFYQYLPGFVAWFTNDTAAAVRELERAAGIRGNDRDPQIHSYLGLAYEKSGQPPCSEEAGPAEPLNAAASTTVL